MRAKMETHAKHPKASMVLGCCTLCWATLGAFFLFAGSVAVFNLSVEDAYFSGPRGINPTTNLPDPVGSIRKARSFQLLSSFISTADIYDRFTQNKSLAQCYGGDANEGKYTNINKDTGCVTYQLESPKCIEDGNVDTVTAKWQLAKIDDKGYGNYLARKDIISKTSIRDNGIPSWRNKTVADFNYKVSPLADTTNAGFTLTSMFAIFTGLVALLSTFKLTDTRKMMLLILFFTLMVSTYGSYSSLGYFQVQQVKAFLKNCQGMSNETYFSTREIPQCRVKSGSTKSVAEDTVRKYFTATDYENYHFRCDLIEDPKMHCNTFPQCYLVPDDEDSKPATDSKRSTVALKKGTCVNRLMDGYYEPPRFQIFGIGSYQCNEAQLPFWNKKNNKCGESGDPKDKFSDRVEGVTYIQGAKEFPCGDETLYDVKNCFQKKAVKCTMNITEVVSGPSCPANSSVPLCEPGNDFFYDFDKAYIYNTATQPNHQAYKENYEPCSNDKTIWGNVTKAYKAYHDYVPNGVSMGFPIVMNAVSMGFPMCITDQKGENLDKLAGAFLARAAVLDWGLSFIYVELVFLLLTILHSFYCAGGKSESESSPSDRKQSNVEMGRAKPNPFGPGQ